MDALPKDESSIADGPTAVTRFMIMQDRDWEVLKGLFEFKTVTTTQIANAYFDGRYEMAKKRLQKLKAAGLVRERVRQSCLEPLLLRLGKAGLALLRSEGIVRR